MLNKNSAVVRTSSTNVKKLDERLFIGTLGVNCLQYTRRCIESVRSSCAETRFLYIDNGSKPENVEEIKTWQKRNPDITEFGVAFNGQNAGVGPGWNQLISVALDWKATKIIICNNDIAFGDHTINGLVEAYDRLREYVPETVMVTATNHTKNPNQLHTIKQEWKYHEHPDFSCFMIAPETIDRIGFFSEQYLPAFFEDNDMHWRMLLTGYKAFGTDWAPYSHVASRTRYENPEIVTHINFRENKIKFYREMMTDDVKQEIADERYQHWLSKYPDIKHPKATDVLDLAIADGLITGQLQEWLAQLHWKNVT